MIDVSDSSDLTSVQVRYLNDIYFASDPTEYFEAKLWQLMTMPDATVGENGLDDEGTETLAARFFGLLPEFRFVPDGDDKERRRRATVIDALALRHHIAETTLRLYMALRMPDCRIPWFHMANDKSPDEFSKFCRLVLAKDERADEFREEVRRVAFPPATEPQDPSELEGFVVSIESWLRHAAWIISDEGLDLGVAHNQVKHGLALVATEKLRVDVLTEVQDPSSPTADELNNGLPVINAASIRYLDRHRPDKGHEFGWSLRTENADPATALAEAHMGIMTLRVFWKVGKVRYAPWHVVAPGEPVEYWQHPLPAELFGRSRTAGARISWPLILPRPKERRGAPPTGKV